MKTLSNSSDRPRTVPLLVADPGTLALAVVIAAAIVAALPEWREDWYQDDQLPVVFRVLHTDLAHHHGVLYPRVAPELGFGYGRMLHQFYPPLGVELAAWLHALGLGYLDATRLTYSLCLVASALGMYAFAAAVLRQRPMAVLAAVVYVWSPYLLLDAHRGGVLGESLSLALIPWTLLSFHILAARGGWTSVGAGALGIAAITLAHNITALCFVGLALVYGGLIVFREARADRAAAGPGLALIAGAVGLGLLLSGFYWAPALLELEFSNLGEQRKGEFSVGRHLVEPLNLLQPSLLFDYDSEPVPRYGLVAGLLTVAAIVLFAIAALRRTDRQTCKGACGPELLPVAGFATAFVAMLAMQIEAALPIWESVPLISFLQFPQRLFVFASFAGAVLIGTLPWSISRMLGESRSAPREVVWSAAAAIAALSVGLASLPGIWSPPPPSASHRISEDQVGLGTVGERRLSERSAYDDYFPVWVEESATQIPRSPSANRAEEYRAANDGPVPRLRVVRRDYLGWRLETEAATSTTVVLHTFYFPGWRATVDGDHAPVEPVGPLGLARVTIPPGTHAVVVEFADTPIRQIAGLLSVIALALLIAVFVLGIGARRTAVGLAALALSVALPWLGHVASSPIGRPEPIAINADVTPHARLVAVEPPPPHLSPGDSLHATLIWQATDHTSADLQSGLRVERLDGGRPVAERWGTPARETTPTGKWMIGELIPDPVSVRIPPDTTPGRFRIVAGLRDRAGPKITPIGEIEIR